MNGGAVWGDVFHVELDSLVTSGEADTNQESGTDDLRGLHVPLELDLKVDLTFVESRLGEITDLVSVDVSNLNLRVIEGHV